MDKGKRRVSPERSARRSLAPDMQLAHHNLTLSEARWSHHRRKIGLTPLSRAHKSFNAPTYDDLKQELVMYVKDNFKRKECIRFVPKPDPKRKKDDAIKCYCGEVPERHIKNIAGVSEFFQHGVDATANDLSSGKMTTEWVAKKDIIEMATNGFGKIEFVHEGLGGRKPAKYVRITDTTPEDKVISFMVDHWRMNQPKTANLVITVIGGAKNFKLDGKKKDVFNRGLINAAQTTHAWILTSGCNMGVMKAVGEAVAEGQSYNWDKLGMTHSLRCVGIAPWGYVERNTALISNDGFGSWNAAYKVNNTIRHGHPVSLNPNHTHFILVDDGFRGRYGGVASLRAKLERKISMPQADGGLGIPVVLVVVEGGYDAIDDVSRSLEAKIPVVVCEGTGRAADILAYAYRSFVTTRKGERVMKDKHKMILDMKLCDAYGNTWAQRSDERKEAEKYLRIVLKCCEDEKLLTVFDMHKHEDLDLAILSALLKGQGATNLDQLHDQLKLALTWNRSDVAEEKIFTQDISWPTGSLDDIMTDALIDNKVDFVRLLLQNGVVMKEYLTVSRLRKLYNSVSKSSHLRELLQQQTKYPTFTLRDVGKLLRKLMGKHEDDIYQNDDDIRQFMLREESLREQEIIFPKPFRELFIWAVLMNRQEMARFLWERGDEAIPSAIAASRIYGSLSDLVAHYDSDLRDMYNLHKEQFEMLAVKVLDECHRTDPEKAAMLIERKYTTWGDVNCLEMAAAAVNKEFLSTVSCQNSLNLMWKRGIASQSAAVFFGLLFPPLVLFRIRFESLGDVEALTWWQKLITFYRAPVTKFAGNVLMYLVFLFYYSYVILFDFRIQMTINEKIVICWIFTLLIEEIRQMFGSSNADKVTTRIKDWWDFSVFNRIDLFILVLAVIGFGMRFDEDLFIHAKAIYCVNSVLCFIRLLRDYSASSFLGPKLVMITTMLKELLLYIMILIVFLLAYGVSTNALMYPIREPYLMIIKDIFYYPYWQIYGELFLDELEGRTEDCRNSTIDSFGNPCPTYHWLVPALTALYLLVGNLLLLNILIAIFNHVFNEIQNKSIQIWKYGMYFLVVEYDNKPALAPPFIFLEHIAMFFKWLICKACCKKHIREEPLTEKLTVILKIFEKEMLKIFLRKQQEVAKDDIKRNVTKIMNRVDEMAKQIEEERLLEQQHYEAEQNKLEGTGGYDSTMSMQYCPLPYSAMPHGISPRRRTRESGHFNINADVSSQNIDIPSPSKPTQKKYARWPSMDQIKLLKSQMENERLESIEEGKVSKSPGGMKRVESWNTTDRETPVWASNSESELGNLREGTPLTVPDDDAAYDRLNFGDGRLARSQNPNYDHVVIASEKISNLGSKPASRAAASSTRDTEPLIESEPKQRKRKHRKKKALTEIREEANKVKAQKQQSWDNRAFDKSEDSDNAAGDVSPVQPPRQDYNRMESQLHNIEALLRTTVFQGGARQSGSPAHGQAPAAMHLQSRPAYRHKSKPWGYQPPSDDEYEA